MYITLENDLEFSSVSIYLMIIAILSAVFNLFILWVFYKSKEVVTYRNLMNLNIVVADLLTVFIITLPVALSVGQMSFQFGRTYCACYHTYSILLRNGKVCTMAFMTYFQSMQMCRALPTGNIEFEHFAFGTVLSWATAIVSTIVEMSGPNARDLLSRLGYSCNIIWNYWGSSDGSWDNSQMQGNIASIYLMSFAFLFIIFIHFRIYCTKKVYGVVKDNSQMNLELIIFLFYASNVLFLYVQHKIPLTEETPNDQLFIIVFCFLLSQMSLVWHPILMWRRNLQFIEAIHEVYFINDVILRWNRQPGTICRKRCGLHDSTLSLSITPNETKQSRYVIKEERSRSGASLEPSEYVEQVLGSTRELPPYYHITKYDIPTVSVSNPVVLADSSISVPSTSALVIQNPDEPPITHSSDPQSTGEAATHLKSRKLVPGTARKVMKKFSISACKKKEGGTTDLENEIVSETAFGIELLTADTSSQTSINACVDARDTNSPTQVSERTPSESSSTGSSIVMFSSSQK